MTSRRDTGGTVVSFPFAPSNPRPMKPIPLGWYAGLPLAIAVPLASLTTSPALAIRLNHRGGQLDFSHRSGDFRILGGSVDNDIVTLYQEVTGPDLDLISNVDGLNSLTPYNVVNSSGAWVGSISGFWFQSVVTNRTQSSWEFFDHELQETLGLASSNNDGLSFAQNLAVTPTSDRFGQIDETKDVRDYINYSQGTVAPGQTVSFKYFISDTSATSRFFLRQRPNFQSGTPTPTPSPTPTPTPAPSPTPTPAPAPTSTPEPTPAPQSVPEPGVLLGLLSLGGGAIAHRRRCHVRARR